MEIPTRNISMSRRHYGLVVKIFVFGYKGCGFESPHLHFHTGDPATCNTQSTPTSISPLFKLLCGTGTPWIRIRNLMDMVRIQTTPTCAKAVYFSRMAMVVFNLSFLNFSREKMDILSDTSCCLALSFRSLISVIDS